MSQTPVVLFENVGKVYREPLSRREVVALRGVTLDVRPGEVFGLLGPNRAGKTTLVKILLTLTRATSGSVARFGRPVEERDTLRRVGYTHENQAFPRYWSADGLLRYYGALAGLGEADARARAAPLLERVGIADRADEPIRRFSKGMVQRLALAQALLADPDLLVLDEPAEGLDLLGRELVHDLIRDHRRRGKTVILVTHLPAEVEALCDRVGVVNRGTLAYLGPTADLTRPAKGERRTLAEALRALYEKAHA